MLERGKFYTIESKYMFCMNCFGDITELSKGAVLLYLGKLDGENFFIYNDPIQCPTCNAISRYHVENGMRPIEVTQEFKSLDKKP